MKKILCGLCFLGFHESFCQVVKDLDKDGIKDTVSFDSEKGIISCRLSTKGFRPIVSKAESSDGMNAEVRATKNGFELSIGHMRSGYANQFRYEEKEKKIRLIGMSRYGFGPASNDGSGESSVNLLTNSYIGEWNAYDSERKELIKLPVIKTKMYFPKVYLENYDSSYQNNYEEQCSAMYYKERSKYK